MRAAAFVSVLLSLSAATAATAAPNVLLILADDLGWSDVRVNGGRFADTPNIDRLAAQGIRFTQAYSPAPICSPSRAAILTGKSPARLGFEFVTKPLDAHPGTTFRLLSPPFTRDLPLEETTIAELLRGAGYRTGIVGKWHVSQHYQHYLGYSPTHGPQKQGFDYAVEAFGSHPYGYKEREFSACADGDFMPDAWTEEAVRFLERNRDRPFFLYAPSYYVHTPVHTRCRWLFDKYAERWKQRKAPSDGLKGMSGAQNPEDAAMYGAFVETLDRQIGRLLDALDRLGLADETLVLLASDNGGHPQYAWNRPLRGSKWNLYEGGIRTPLIVRWPGETESGTVSDFPAIGMDLFATIADVVGTSVPEPIDGVSLAPVLRGDAEPERDALVWHFPYYHPEKNPNEQPQSAIRMGRWKLIRYYDSEHSELYDLSEDLSEQRDLSAILPRKAHEMEQELMRRLKAVGARFPTPHPAR